MRLNIAGQQKNVAAIEKSVDSRPAPARLCDVMSKRDSGHPEHQMLSRDCGYEPCPKCGEPVSTFDDLENGCADCRDKEREERENHAYDTWKERRHEKNACAAIAKVEKAFGEITPDVKVAL